MSTDRALQIPLGLFRVGSKGCRWSISSLEAGMIHPQSLSWTHCCLTWEQGPDSEWFGAVTDPLFRFFCPQSSLGFPLYGLDEFKALPTATELFSFDPPPDPSC